MINSDLDKAMRTLEAEAASVGDENFHKYRRLELDYESEIRLGFTTPSTWELLIVIGTDSEYSNISTPNWKGMRFEIISMEIPKENTRHLRLSMTLREYKSIFFTVCSDLIKSLDKPYKSDQRGKAITLLLDRWSRFFERFGQDGLSPERQRGLFGELWWLHYMLSFKADILSVINSWKGCDNNFHDFILNDHAVEVKTTIMKEPRKVRINNEKQLDSSNFNSLHLLVISLQNLEENGVSLPDLVNLIRSSLSGYETSESSFEHSLYNAGYIDAHEPQYSDRYVITNEELFSVRDGFPRLTEVPQGLGDLNYSLVVSACKNYEVDRSIYLKGILN